jgi:hypothetical protein
MTRSVARQHLTQTEPKALSNFLVSPVTTQPITTIPIVTNHKKSRTILFQGSPAVISDPWLSVSTFRQIWLCLASVKLKIALDNLQQHLTKNKIEADKSMVSATESEYEGPFGEYPGYMFVTTAGTHIIAVVEAIIGNVNHC